MELSELTPIFAKKDLPFSELDGVFRKIAGEMTDGYVTARDKSTLRYFFVINGKPYACGLVDGSGKRLTKVQDFFVWYKERGAAELNVYKADKKLLLCMLVKLDRTPAQTFTTDTVNLEDVIKKIEEQKKDVIMTLHSGAEWWFVIFIKGRAVYAYLPLKKGVDEPPIESLLLYSYGLGPDKPLSVEIFTDMSVAPSDDIIAFTDEGIATHYTKSSHGAYVELIEDGVQKGIFPLTDELTIGRETTNMIYLAEAGVSRFHAVIKGSDGRYAIEDLKSSNGTFFKGVRIPFKELYDGDEIHIRKYILRFHGLAMQRKEPTKLDLVAETVYSKEVIEKVEGISQPRGASLTMEDGRVYQLGSITTIGKDEGADVRVEGMLVAKRHAVIVRGKDMFKLIRKGTLSPVKVNGEKIEEHTLKDGDAVEIGNHVMTFRAGRTSQ